MTVNIGAKCSDGIALIADKKYTNISLGKENLDSEVFGDAAHFLTLFTGQYKATQRQHSWRYDNQPER